MEKTKKTISILLVFLLSIGVCCNFKVFAQEVDLSISKEEYNERMIKDLGLEQNPTLKDVDYVLDFIDSLITTNSEGQKNWFSLNGRSDLMSLYIYYQSALEDSFFDDTKMYNVGYSTVDGYIRTFTIDGLAFTYSGVMPTNTAFGIPFYSKSSWNNPIERLVKQNPDGISGGERLKTRINLFAETNEMLIENHLEWGLSVNDKILPSEITSIADSIKESAKYKVEYTMDNGYIRHLTVKEITSTSTTEIPGTEQTPTTSGQTGNPTESQTDTQNQETNKQHILDDEPNTGLVF